MKKSIVILIIVIIFINLGSIPCAGSSPDSSPEIHTARLKHEIRAIMADQRFIYPDPLGWWNKIGKAIDIWLKKFQQWLQKFRTRSQDRSGGILTRLLNYLGLACLALLPFLLVYYLPRVFHKENRIKRVPLGSGTTFPRPVQLVDEAAGWAAQGEYREAIRTLYLAVLEDYKNRSLLPNGRLLTDKENLLLLRRSLGADHNAYGSFDQLIRIFREKWYGLKDCLASDYEHVLHLSKIIMENTGKINAKP